MWINKFTGILAINQKSAKDITEGILFPQGVNLSGLCIMASYGSKISNFLIDIFLIFNLSIHKFFKQFFSLGVEVRDMSEKT